MTPLAVNFMDDNANEFVITSFDLFYVDVKMTTDRKMIVSVMGVGFAGDFVRTSPEGVTIPLKPLIREVDKADIFTGRAYNPEECYVKRNRTKEDRKFTIMTLKPDELNRKSIAEKLTETLRVMEKIPEPNLYIEIKMLGGTKGMVINVTVKRLAANTIIPTTLKILQIIGMKDEMNMNNIIRACKRTLKQIMPLRTNR